jgi:hypothetical protein
VSRQAKWAAVVYVVVVAACQSGRPQRSNATTDSSRAIAAQVGTASGLVAVLDRACGECHSNGTTGSWYAQVPPLSWVMAYGAAEARKAVDFSEWAAYPPEQRRQLLVESCRDASEGRMPGRAYTLLRPEARLSADDVETICAAARRSDGGASR